MPAVRRFQDIFRGAGRLSPVEWIAPAYRLGRPRRVAVETVAGAPLLWDAPLRFPLALVFGNEALGVAADALAACDACVRLPVYGRKNSLNVGNCAAAVVYEALRQHYTRGGW